MPLGTRCFLSFFHTSTMKLFLIVTSRLQTGCCCSTNSWFICIDWNKERGGDILPFYYLLFNGDINLSILIGGVYVKVGDSQSSLLLHVQYAFLFTSTVPKYVFFLKLSSRLYILWTLAADGKPFHVDSFWGVCSFCPRKPQDSLCLTCVAGSCDEGNQCHHTHGILGSLCSFLSMERDSYCFSRDLFLQLLQIDIIFAPAYG